MCDEWTAQDDDAAAARGLNRREFTAAGMAAVIAGFAGTGASATTALSESAVTIATPDGTADAFFVHPASGRHPGIVLWPDIAGLRETYRLVARRLAAAGYAVLAVNQYYRNGAGPVLNSLSEWRTPEGQAKLQPRIAAITHEGTTRDAAAFVRWLDTQAPVDTARRIGTQGYCMGGPAAVRTAAAAPDRVGAAVSFHGASLVTDRPDSPHRLIGSTKAAFLFAIGQNDDARAPQEKDALRAAAQAAGRPAEVEVYAADHGWCTPDAPSFDAAEAERAWGRMMALYAAL